jgi:glucose/arabinose dehydrogenase
MREYGSHSQNRFPSSLLETMLSNRIHARLIRALAASTGVLATLTACTAPAAQSSGGTSSVGSAAPLPANCSPIETRPPNAKGQTPAFPGQTRICGVTSNVPFDVVVVAKGLEHPWSVEPLPDGQLLVTERPGRLRLISASGDISDPIAGILPVAAAGQGGLLDVALSPTFATDRTIFWTFSEPRDGGNGTAIARGVLSADRKRVDDVRVIFRVMPTYNGKQHFGSRIAFGPDGMLYASFGERSDTPMRPNAQQLDGHLGKVIRIRPDGTVPNDNPFVGRAGYRPEIYTLGHRNTLALIVHPITGELWNNENGPNGGDEINILKPGANYGWPLVSYGRTYPGPWQSGDRPTHDGFEPPVVYWVPAIAVSGMAFYTGDRFPKWKGDVFVGSLRTGEIPGTGHLERILFNEKMQELRREALLRELRQRIRDVRQGPDGLLYIVTDEKEGAVLRIEPAN